MSELGVPRLSGGVSVHLAASAVWRVGLRFPVWLPTAVLGQVREA